MKRRRSSAPCGPARARGWAFRFLQGVPGVTVILSGMSNQEQLEANLDTFETDKPLTDAERSALLDIAGGMVNSRTLPCTACRYCMPCPFGLDIPKTLAAWNMTAVDEDEADKFYGELEVKADSCRACGHCEKECPQRISVSQVMKQIAGYFKEKQGA